MEEDDGGRRRRWKDVCRDISSRFVQTITVQEFTYIHTFLMVQGKRISNFHL